MDYILVLMMVKVLTIAGSDPSGGAGVQADLKVFSALGVWGLSVLTSLTVQNSQGVQEVYPLPPWFVNHQLGCLLQEGEPKAVKTGMLFTSEVVEAVVGVVKGHRLKNLVVDPVMEAKGGEILLKEEGRRVLRERLLPLALLATPNLKEAERLGGVKIEEKDDMREAAAAILDHGPQWVLLKGGHLVGDPIDLLSNGEDYYELVGQRIGGEGAHGTGCTLSAAITAYLAQGEEIVEAVRLAKDYLSGVLHHTLKLGRGNPVLDHLYKWREGGEP